MFDDTICAPATAPVRSPIGIIRISGPETLRAVAALFMPAERITPRTAVYGTISENGTIVDDVIVVYYRSPRSFTGEDMAEIFCHGNPLIINRILLLLHRQGIRLAQPGEFSRRSFLNGKIDLTGAEAINHIITARSQWEIDASLKQMHGSLRNKVNEIRTGLINLKADIECGIDFIEEEIEFISYNTAVEQMDGICSALLDIRKRCSIGDRLSRGIDLPIVGKPNVGKSSILNLILNSERALVSDIPGTTRDVIRESVQIKGIHVNLVDTAGIDSPVSDLDRMGIELSNRKIDDSSLILMVIDGVSGIHEQDRKIIERLQGKNRIYLINKTDIAPAEKIDEIASHFPGAVLFSAKTGAGLNELEDRIAEIITREFIDYRDFYLADAHMTMLLDDAVGEARRVIELLRRGEPQEIVAFQMDQMLEKVSGVIGEVTPDEVLNTIFDRFCIGK